ncbi:MAG: hypothetical protein Salg2KO_12340 [Salibacteraceae bacterium]
MDSVRNVHPEIKPLSSWEIDANGGSVIDSNALHRIPDYHDAGNNRLEIGIEPRINGTGFYETGNQSGVGLESFAGAAITANYNNKVMLSADVLAGYNEPVSYLSNVTDSLFVVPSFSYANRQGGYGFHQSTINLSWRPSHVVELHAGRGKHFIGEGYRSLFLSDYASNYNYLRTDVNVWRLKYTVLYTQMRSAQGYPSSFYPLINKYATMHYLSLNATNWWTVGAFETVVWESEDVAQRRELDINYLNPIIFFRPVEFSTGSSANSLLGFSSTIRPTRGLTLYGQFLIDEFVFREVIAPITARIYPDSNIQTAWWGNKQSYQLGIKYHEPFGWKDATTLLEFNAVRPYTYSHGNENQDYVHMNQPLAHPLGANLIEWVAVALWQPGKFWNLGLRATYARKGHSTQTFNTGEEPMVNSVFLINEPKYSYPMLQGSIRDLANIRAEASYTLVEHWNFRVESSLQYRMLRTTSSQSNSLIFSLGLRTALWNNYREI